MHHSIIILTLFVLIIESLMMICCYYLFEKWPTTFVIWNKRIQNICTSCLNVLFCDLSNFRPKWNM